MTMKNAYSYTRFSSGKQSTGDSIQRQLNSPTVLAFIEDHKLNVIQTMLDAGVSAFKGKNFSNESALGKFIECIKSGKIEIGSVLIIENLDRFSRDKITNCITKLIEIVNAGVSIGIVSMNMVIDLDQLNENPMLWNYVSNEFNRARSESKRKSEFGLRTIQRKLNEAKAGNKVYFGGLSPCWVSGVKDNQFVLNVDNVATIKRIFKLYLSGVSANGIATLFNTEKVKPLLFGKHFYGSTVKHYLKHKSLIGYVKINDFESDGFYPAIITENDFYKVQSKIEQNRMNRGGSVKHTCPNLFKGIAFCKCGGRIKIDSFDKYAYVACANSENNICRDKHRWKLRDFERDLFFYLLKRTPDELLSKPVQTNSTLQDLQTQLAKVNLVINNTAEMIAGGINLPKIKADLLALQVKENEIKELIQTEHIKSVQSSSVSLAKFKDSFADNADDFDALFQSIETKLNDTKSRFELRNLMPDIFQRIELNMANESYKATLANGQVIERKHLGYEYTGLPFVPADDCKDD